MFIDRFYHVSIPYLEKMVPSKKDIIILSNKYIEDLQNVGTQNQIIKAEYKLWQRKLILITEKPNNALEAMAVNLSKYI